MVRMKVIPPDKVRTHAQRSILTKGLGLSLFVQPDITQWSCRTMTAGVVQRRRVVGHRRSRVCAARSGAASMSDLSQNVIDLALDRQSDDNLSVVAVHLHRLGLG